MSEAAVPVPVAVVAVTMAVAVAMIALAMTVVASSAVAAPVDGLVEAETDDVEMSLRHLSLMPAQHYLHP